MESDLKVYATGLAFERGVYDLRSLELLVSSSRSILDRLIAVQLGRRKLPGKTTRQLNYGVQVKDGSIELLIDFVLDHPETVLAAVVEDGGYQLATTITKLYRDALALRKAAAKMIEKGVSFNIRISNIVNVGSNNTNVVVEGDQIIIPDPKIIFAAQTTRAPTDKLLRKVDGKRIQRVDLSSAEGRSSLEPANRDILGRDKQVLPAKLTIVGRLDVVAFSSHRGVIVADSERYPVTWDDNIRSKMKQVADKAGVLFTVHPVIDHSRLDNDTIGFHVLDCEINQTDWVPHS